MTERDIGYAIDILIACRDIDQFSQGKSLTDLESDAIYPQWAVFALAFFDFPLSLVLPVTVPWVIVQKTRARSRTQVIHHKSKTIIFNDDKTYSICNGIADTGS
jgi:hypothetical protein